MSLFEKGNLVMSQVYRVMQKKDGVWQAMAIKAIHSMGNFVGGEV